MIRYVHPVFGDLACAIDGLTKRHVTLRVTFPDGVVERRRMTHLQADARLAAIWPDGSRHDWRS